MQSSRITNKWVRLGVPLVGCGDSSDVAHENLWPNIYTQNKNLCINFLKIEHLWPSSLKCMVSHYPSPYGRLIKLPTFAQVYWYKSCSAFSAHRGEKWRCRHISLNMHPIILDQKTDPNLHWSDACIPSEISRYRNIVIFPFCGPKMWSSFDINRLGQRWVILGTFQMD